MRRLRGDRAGGRRRRAAGRGEPPGRVPPVRRVVRGRFTGRPEGDGWLVPLGAGSDPPEDLHITRGRLGGVLPGDLAEAEVLFRTRSGRPEGEVLRVLERSAGRLVGELTAEGSVVVWDPQWSREVLVSAGGAAGARAGDLVEVRIRPSPAGDGPIMGEVRTVFGSSHDPAAEVAAVLARHDIRDAFPREALEQADAAPSAVRSRDLAGREDLRSRLIVTLDPPDAKDHDDAIEAAPRPDGGFRIGVHIADVGHYVPPGSPVDREAALRANSAYFPERSVPMLPPALSSGICSLVAGRDRLTRSVELEISAEGILVDARCFRAVIASAARLAYGEGAAFLAGAGAGPIADAVRTMGRAAALLAAARRRRGAVDLDLPEPELCCDELGHPLDARYAERTAAHRLVEEFMLLANQAVAERLRAVGAPALHRVHPSPAESRVRQFEDLLGAFGERLRAPSEALRPGHFARLGDRIEGRPEVRFLRRRMLRAMKRAEYSPRGEGHFALALQDYTHFTSPIRRYPDLMVHRALDGIATGPMKAAASSAPGLDALARHCSERERAAEAAETAVVERRLARMLRGRLGDAFAGRVAETGRFGMRIELEEIPARGLVPLALLGEERFRFDRRDYALRSRVSGRSFRIGDRLEAQLVRVDPLRGGLEFRLL